jgi:ATP-dependent helicase/nuclease subunit A
MTSPTARAEAAQLEASNPAVSAFVSASAGSGKTKLLTDRLLRLLLTGAAPGSIHCLTYTKAAAAEMAVRLQNRLGEWVTAQDAVLDADLAKLDLAPTQGLRRTARALFGRVLDLPGGMRIGTIHGFCQSLLRRFPLEAQLSPHFELTDDRDIDDLLNESLEETLASPDMPEQLAMNALAGMVSLDGLHGLIKALRGHQDGWEQIAPLSAHTYREKLAQAAGLTATSRSDLLREAVHVPAEERLRRHLAKMLSDGPATLQILAQAGMGWLALVPEERAARWPDWVIAWLTLTGEKRKLGRMKLLTANPAMAEDCEEEQDRVLRVQDQLATLTLIEASTYLITLAKTVMLRFEAKKSSAGVLDYADLIECTRSLLKQTGAGAWVRYKLDEGIDHLLLDEVQDTSPTQWEIARLLWEEFFAGAGAKEKPRTVFAVGDQKQSIYSFQGADPQGFHRERTQLQKQVIEAGQDFVSPSLDVSFRSAAPILELVDQVFRLPQAAQGVNDANPAGWLTHVAAREGHAGSIELWPLTPVPPKPDREAWKVVNSYQPHVSAKQRLADHLADWIRDQTSGGTALESRGRALRPGDVLILVRKRDDFVRALDRALKQRGVPVAGRDRMKLLEEPAVQDLLALCEVLLLPEDHLSLAEFLTSPLGGLEDNSLMELGLGRGGASLFQTLETRAGERADWREAFDFLRRLLPRADFVTPYELLAEALGPCGGRARLLARLGPDASEPIDELLAAALRHAELHPPSLQSFLHWLRNSGAEIKREAEAAGGLVRIMTVHGAKGLQAPLVILPQTTSRLRNRGGIHFPAHALPFWQPGKQAACGFASEAHAEADRLERDEENRLLYVALTRAEDRLLICGAEPRKDDCWHDLIVRGLAALPAESEDFVPWPGLRVRYATAQTAAAKPDAAKAAAEPPPIPAWLGTAPGWRPAPLPAEPSLPRPLAPSRPQDAALGPIPPAGSPDQPADKFARGKLIHLLLQHLPDLAPEAREEAALKTALASPAITPADARHIVAQLLGLLADPALAALFGPHSRGEVPLSGLIGAQVVQGVVDRLAVLPDRVMIADYKSNRAKPARVPVLYLRQMAAYRAVIGAIFPDHAVDCRLIWTQDGSISHLQDADLAHFAPT